MKASAARRTPAALWVAGLALSVGCRPKPVDLRSLAEAHAPVAAAGALDPAATSSDPGRRAGDDPWPARTPEERLAEARRATARLLSTPPLTADEPPRSHRLPPELIDQSIVNVNRRLEEIAVDDPQHPDLLFRLADLYLDKKQHLTLEARALHGKQREAERRGEAAVAQGFGVAQQRREDAARAASQRAVEVLTSLVDDPRFARYLRIDQALYLLGVELGELGREQEMTAAYHRLLRERSGQFFALIYRNFGDFYFERGRHDEARKFYAKVVDNYRDSRVYIYGLYMLGRCEVRGGEVERARGLARIVEAFGLSHDDQRADRREDRRLRPEIGAALVDAYADAGEPGAALALFTRAHDGQRQPEARARKMLGRLAATYFHRGRYPESIVAYRVLQSNETSALARCSWQWRVFLSSLGTGDADAMARERAALLRDVDDLGDDLTPEDPGWYCVEHGADARRVLIDPTPAGP